MKNAEYIKVEDMMSYLKTKIEAGKLWGFNVEDENELFYIAVQLKDNISYIVKKKKAINIEKGNFVLIDENKNLSFVAEDDFRKKYKICDTNDYYQLKQTLKCFNSKKDLDELFIKNDYKQSKHERESYIFNQICTKENFEEIQMINILNNEEIINARLAGLPINYNALSDYCAEAIASQLDEEGIPYVVFTSFFEEDLDSDREFDVNEMLKDDKDNILITLERDAEEVQMLLNDNRINEMIQKSACIDNMTLEELVLFKSQLLSMKVGRNLPGVQEKILNALSTLDKIEAQVEQEILEKNEIYSDRDEQELSKRKEKEKEKDKDKEEREEELERSLF